MYLLYQKLDRNKKSKGNKKMNVIYDDSTKIPIKTWCNNIEDNALQQAKNLSNLPFVFKHIVLMPDCHSGYGMPIGGVLATKNIIIPNAVGSDIACGMNAVKTNIAIKSIYIDMLKSIMGDIRKVIPVGKKHQDENQNEIFIPDLSSVTSNIILKQYPSILRQIGTLGGGNHFLELQQDTNGFLWIMLHSGSRNLGKQVADYYKKIAKELNQKWFSSVNKSMEKIYKKR